MLLGKNTMDDKWMTFYTFEIILVYYFLHHLPSVILYIFINTLHKKKCKTSSFFLKMKMRGKFHGNKKSITFGKKEKYIQNKFCLLEYKNL